MFAPAGTAPRLIDRLNRELSEIAAQAEMRAILEPDGMQPLAMSPMAFATRLQQELAQWKQIAATRKIIAE